MLKLFSTLAFASLAMLAPVTVHASKYEHTLDSFRVWQSRHDISYESHDHEGRAFQVWSKNLRLIQSHNELTKAGHSTFTLSMNRFGAMSHAEFQSIMLRPATKNSVRHADSGALYTVDAEEKPLQTLPTSVNWVYQGVVPGIVDQGDCGSCWAFSAVAAMEGAYNWKNQNNTASQCDSKCGPHNLTCCSFSEQEVADCTRGGADTCNIGGEPHDGILNTVQRGGKINTESQYPYTSGKSGKLSRCAPVANPVSTSITGYANVTSGDENALAVATAKYPVISIGIDASNELFQFYASGIYVDKQCKNTPAALDHGVAIVGYGSGNPIPPGPPPPKPGPSNCMKNYYKPECVGEKGCHWCVDSSGLGYCLNEPCPNNVASTQAAPKDYWLIRNSWGNGWGMNGYIAMARNHDNMCGVATDAVFAVI